MTAPTPARAETPPIGPDETVHCPLCGRATIRLVVTADPAVVRDSLGSEIYTCRLCPVPDATMNFTDRVTLRELFLRASLAREHGSLSGGVP